MAGYEGFETVAPPAQAAPAAAPAAAPPAASYAGFERVAEPGLAESFFRGAGQGVTLGFGDEIGLLSRERQEAARSANPWTYFLGEVAGSVAPMLGAAPIAAGRLGTSLVARGAQAVARPFAAGDMATLPRAVGQGAKLGASYGAVTGAGNADPSASASIPEAVGARLSGAVTGGVVGGGLGGVLGAATYPISRAAQSIGGARAAAEAELQGGYQGGALTAMSRAFERDRITPQDLIAQIRTEFPTDTAAAGGPGVRWWGSGALPAAQRGVWTADMVEDVVRRSLSGEDAATISGALRQAAGGNGPGESAVSRLLGELSERHAVPLNIADRAKLTRAGAGENTGWTLRAASATPGEPRALARERLVERQLGQGGRLDEAITRYVGTPDFDGRSAQLAEQVATRNAQLYDQAHNIDAQMIALGRTVGDAVQPVLDAHALKWVYSRGPTGSAIREAIEAFRPAELRPGQPPIDRPMGSLQEFMQAKQELQAILDKHVTNKSVMRELMSFKNDLYKAVGEFNPQWRVANDAAADGFAATRALNLGMEYAGRLGPQTREQLARYRNMSPPEQELYRVGVAQRLHERIMNRQETHDLTSELRLPATRQTLRTILGDDAANALFRRVDREFATTRTYREQFGSQTTPLREAIDELSWAPQMQSVWDLANPAKIAEQTAIWAARNWNEGRNQQLLNMLTTVDPIEQLAILRTVQPVNARRTTWGRNTSNALMPSGPGGANFLTQESAANDRAQRRLGVGR